MGESYDRLDFLLQPVSPTTDPAPIQFELRCDTGDYDTAATVLRDIDVEYLQVWGHYHALVDLHERLRR